MPLPGEIHEPKQTVSAYDRPFPDHAHLENLISRMRITAHRDRTLRLRVRRLLEAGQARRFRQPQFIEDAETALALDWYRVGKDIMTAAEKVGAGERRS